MRLLFLISVLSVLLAGCYKNNPPSNAVLLYGHGGAGFDVVNSKLPYNSIKSIDQALVVYGLDGVEIDLQFTKDGELVLFHDTDLELSTDCSGKVGDKSLLELMACSYRNEYFNTGSQHIVSFDSFLERFTNDWHSKFVSISINTYPENLKRFSTDSMASIIREKIEGSGITGRCNVESRDIGLLQRIKEKNSAILVYLTSSLDQQTINACVSDNLDGLVVSHTESSDELQEQLKSLNKHLVLYGQLSQKDYINQSYTAVVGLQVDNPIQALKYFNRD
jgi:glycerophosphoryl diester phosphodiesterase